MGVQPDLILGTGKGESFDGRLQFAQRRANWSFIEDLSPRSISNQAASNINSAADNRSDETIPLKYCASISLTLPSALQTSAMA